MRRLLSSFGVHMQQSNFRDAGHVHVCSEENRCWCGWQILEYLCLDVSLLLLE